ncbi:MAG: MarR family transcriptional regulator [Alphaproteobacteria bacterium]|jgi:DNA-binding MarR family transcriptional regulator|uniref:MarR family winged helix-turn-helix transcriptional regulator n=1 Tax=Pacificispira sp. TaxID=2888761 RepID=UPI0032F6ABAC
MNDTQTDNAGVLPIADMICFSVYSAGHAFNRVYKPLLDRLGVTYPQYLVLISLWDRDDQTVGALGKALMLESNTLTPLLKRLEGMGLVSRARDPQDERQVRVKLTDAGRALRGEADSITMCILEATGLPIEELRDLQAKIVRLRDHLNRAAA